MWIGAFSEPEFCFSQMQQKKINHSGFIPALTLAHLCHIFQHLSLPIIQEQMQANNQYSSHVSYRLEIVLLLGPLIWMEQGYPWGDPSYENFGIQVGWCHINGQA
jgi:hypothetical protein